MVLIKVELRAAEGGVDAKLLTQELTSIYERFCKRKDLSITKKLELAGTCTLFISGDRAYELFKNESGGHRWQRVPPSEKGGRVHTSTVTVAVTNAATQNTKLLNEEDVEESFMRGSGKGGQHRNKTSTACRLKHIPSGLSIRVESQRSQAQNRALAWKELEKRLAEIHESREKKIASTNVKTQIGSGQRGDKRRTYREKDGVVVDHISNKKARYDQILSGELELLWS